MFPFLPVGWLALRRLRHAVRLARSFSAYSWLESITGTRSTAMESGTGCHSFCLPILRIWRARVLLILPFQVCHIPVAGWAGQAGPWVRSGGGLVLPTDSRTHTICNTEKTSHFWFHPLFSLAVKTSFDQIEVFLCRRPDTVSVPLSARNRTPLGHFAKSSSTAFLYPSSFSFRVNLVG